MTGDVEVGRLGLRTFRVDRDGHLLPLGRGDRFDWRDGVCVAECRRGGLHRPPAEGCSCGIYCFTSLERLQTQYPTARDVVAVVAPEGRARIGENGVVSERARVLALWTADERLTARVRRATSERITPYADLEELVSDYGLRFTAELADPAPLRGRDWLRTVVTEAARSVGGLGWASLVWPAVLAAAATLLVSSLAGVNPATSHPQAVAVAELARAGDRAVLIAGQSVVPLVVALLLLTTAVAIVRLGVRYRAAGDIDRLMRHSVAATLRRFIGALVFVGTYLALAQRFPGWPLIAWTAALVVLSSWAHGGAVYHLIRAVTRRVSAMRAPGPVYPAPTLGELLEAARARQRRGGADPAH